MQKRHAAFDINFFRRFPSFRHIGSSLRGSACEIKLGEGTPALKWSRVTCKECLLAPNYLRAFEVYQAARDELSVSRPPTRQIPSMDVTVIWKHEALFAGGTDALLQPLSEYAMLPARYYVYVDKDATWLHLEAFGSRDKSDPDKYYRALLSADLPFPIFRYPEEPSRDIETIERIELNIMTGQRTASWAFQRRSRRGTITRS